MKGTLKAGEDPQDATRRELREESGLNAPSFMIALGVGAVDHGRQQWQFFGWVSTGLPDTWSHQTEDDHGHTFRFFWQPLDTPLDEEWHPIFHEAFDYFVPLLVSDQQLRPA